MKIKHLPKALELAIKSKVAVFLWGPPGIGKSSVVKQVGRKLGLEVKDVRLSQFDPSDLRGIPFPDKTSGKTVWYYPSWLPDDGEGILFFDELNLAPPLVQASAYQLILDRRLGDYKLPDGWSIIAAGNRAEDRAYVWELSSALANRFVHIEVETDLESWKLWALRNDIDHRVIAFLSYRPNLLLDVQQGTHSFPTPRSWEFVSKILKNSSDDVDSRILKTLIEGAVGKGPAHEFMAFLKLQKQISDVEKVYDTGKIPNLQKQKADRMYLFAEALSYVCAKRMMSAKDDEEKMNVLRKVKSFSQQLPPEYSSMFVHDFLVRVYDRERAIFYSSQEGEEIIRMFAELRRMLEES